MLTTTVFPLFPQPRHFRSRTKRVKIETTATPILFLANSLAEDLNARSRRVRRTERAPGVAWALTRVRSWGRAGRATGLPRGWRRSPPPRTAGTAPVTADSRGHR